MVQELTTATFDEATASGVCVIDFWAPWCGPCRMMGPLFETVADDMKDTAARFYKLNVDEAPEIAARFGVQSIPTLLVLKDGVEAEVRVGVTPPPALRKIVEEALR